MLNRTLLSSAPLLACLLVGSNALAANFFVTTAGNDGNPGNEAQPFRTIRRAATSAMPGDTVFIGGGIYQGAVSLTRSGTATAWITFSALAGELPIIDGGGTGGSGFSSSTAQFIRVVGIAVRNFSSSGLGNGWVNDVGTSNGNWQFVNCIAEGNGINGITFYNATGLLIDGCIVAHNGNMMPSWSSGVNLFHVSGDATTNIVRRTVSFENIDISTTHSVPAGGATDGSGFILDQNSSGALFENNIGFRNGGSCIRINTPGARLVNNTCYHNGLNSSDRTPANPGEIYFSSGPSGAVMINNLGAASGWNNTMNAFVNGPAGMNNLAVNMNGPTPFFTSATGVDFSIVSGSATVIDKGVAAGAPATDIGFDPKCIHQQAGQAVSFWLYAPDYTYIASVGGVASCFHSAARAPGAAPDIGAYEFGGALIPSDAGASGGSGGGTRDGGADGSLLRDAGSGGTTGAGGNNGGGAGAGGSSGAAGSNAGASGSSVASGTGGNPSSGSETGQGGSATAGSSGAAGSSPGGSTDASDTQPGGGPSDGAAGGCACRAAAWSREPWSGRSGPVLLGLALAALSQRRARKRAE